MSQGRPGFFFFQAEDGIRDVAVTGVQTCALPISRVALDHGVAVGFGLLTCDTEEQALARAGLEGSEEDKGYEAAASALVTEIGRASCRERVEMRVVAVR